MRLLAELNLKIRKLKGKQFIEIPAPPNISNSKYFAMGKYILVWKRRKSIWQYTFVKQATANSLASLAHPSFKEEWNDKLLNYYDLLEDLRQEKRTSQFLRIWISIIQGLSLIPTLIFLWILTVKK